MSIGMIVADRAVFALIGSFMIICGYVFLKDINIKWLLYGVGFMFILISAFARQEGVVEKMEIKTNVSKHSELRNMSKLLCETSIKKFDCSEINCNYCPNDSRTICPIVEELYAYGFRLIKRVI